MGRSARQQCDWRRAPVSGSDERLFVVWHGYQRRAEVLASRLGARVVWLPNRWRSSAMRPVDYVRKMGDTFRALDRHRPRLLLLQSPPPFGALAAMALDVPFVIDAHNASLQGYWSRVPLAELVARRAVAVVAHNQEASEIARERFPSATVTVLRDPLDETLSRSGPTERDPRRVLLVCSFGADEPVELVHASIAARTDIEFVITGKLDRLAPEWRDRLRALPNLTLPGFLPTPDYNRLMLTCGAAVVFTNRLATQPSGACEALAAGTPLVVSKTTLTEALFGAWAHLVEHDVDQVSEALDRARFQRLDIKEYRRMWMEAFERELDDLERLIDARLAGHGGPRP